MAERQTVELGDVQRTLFFPLAARARETGKKRPLLRDPKAVEIVESVDFELAPITPGPTAFVVTLRTLIYDWWVRRFLAGHPGGTVIELGTGLNTRFERTDNGTAQWIELDLPDTIELRRRFFADTGRRQMLAASLLDEDWLPVVEQRPGPYFFVADGVLAYLREEDVTGMLARIAGRFPGAMIAFDTVHPDVDGPGAQDGGQAEHRALAMGVRRPALAGAAGPAARRVRGRDPAAGRAASGTARQVPVPAATRRPRVRQARTVAQPVPGWLTSPASDGTCGDGRSRRSTVSSSS